MSTDDNQRMVHRLVVTGPQRDRLYERFARVYQGRNDVEVIRDRRFAERRRACEPVAGDRRAGERRGPAVWVFPPEQAQAGG